MNTLRNDNCSSLMTIQLELEGQMLLRNEKIDKTALDTLDQLGNLFRHTRNRMGVA